MVHRKVKLIGKIFSLRKTDNITMDVHLTKIKNVVDQLEEIGMSLSKDIIVHYTLWNLPKEYDTDTFKEMQTCNDQLPAYEVLEAKLFSKENIQRLVVEDRGEALMVEGHRSTFGNSRNHRLQVQQNPNVFSGGLNNNYHCVMAQRRNSNNV